MLLFFLQSTFSTAYLFSSSRKTLVRNVIDVGFPMPLYRSRFGNRHLSDVLNRVKKMNVSPGAKTSYLDASYDDVAEA